MQKLEILQLKLIGFGKFREKEINLEPGLNLIEGKNEAGKRGYLVAVVQSSGCRDSCRYHRRAV